MNAYTQAFRNGSNSLSDNCDLTGLYCRIAHGCTDEDFSRLSYDPIKRLSWVFDHKTLRNFLDMSHLEMLIHSGHTLDWIRHRLEGKRKFKLIVFSVSSDDEVKLATWDNIFELLSKSYPEIDSSFWYRHSNELKQMTMQDIDPEGLIVKNYYLGPESDGYMHYDRFLSLKDTPTLLQVRAFLHNQIGLNELFDGNGKTMTHMGDETADEYLTINRPLNELNEYALLDLNPILP